MNRKRQANGQMHLNSERALELWGAHLEHVHVGRLSQMWVHLPMMSVLEKGSSRLFVIVAVTVSVDGSGSGDGLIGHWQF
mmetsp:Transcript_42309/g.68611  ORF Transcript_42309/g.68611 Transcript_42309/m.68611 type:complete len:80 (-) Transcript_42309:1238-1477(-)